MKHNVSNQKEEQSKEIYIFFHFGPISYAPSSILVLYVNYFLMTAVLGPMWELSDQNAKNKIYWTKLKNKRNIQDESTHCPYFLKQKKDQIPNISEICYTEKMDQFFIFNIHPLETAPLCIHTT